MALGLDAIAYMSVYVIFVYSMYSHALSQDHIMK